MGRISVACFRPKPGKETELLKVIDDRMPLLRRLGLVTDRPAINCRSKDGIIVSISEWVSEEAIGRAHNTPEVLALWNRFDECSEYVPFTATSESADMFATFDAV